MKLFLASYIRHPTTIERLRMFVGGFEGKTVAYIPTAANGENGWGSWKKGGTWKLVQTLGAKVTLIQLEDYRNDSVIREIVGKNIVWFAGGVPGYLMYWIRRCYVDKHLKNILKKGTIFVGSSAGAMIAGKSMEAASWGFVDGERGSDVIKPLGLVNFDIFPHFEEKHMKKIKDLYRGRMMYLLKNGESIEIIGEKIFFFGKERIIGK
jgi:peptidase E